ncbi:uncharacterized protein BcabD6B2_15860 [Babesia caballi]|uniref:DOT1 domain-containing protein n=1 Tax=Babesia caballi TaxID=5871 RepID=A0AAV4LQM3_BABCB|nr:hypothetical protein, conserved [Babesia caballi]
MRGGGLRPKRRHVQLEDGANGVEMVGEGTPRRVLKASKRRQLIHRQPCPDPEPIEHSSAPLCLSLRQLSRLNSNGVDALAPLLERPNYGAGPVEPTTPTPCEDSSSDYRQLAQSQFRRIYYDLSRGIGIPDDGVGYLFKSGVNDISTSTYGMYGEIKPSCLQKICAEMARFGMDERSVILDLGSGRGAPNFFFAHQVPVFASVGIELCPVSYGLSVHNLLHYLRVDVARSVCESTGFGSAIPPCGSGRHASLISAQHPIADSVDSATCTPQAKRLFKHHDAETDCSSGTTSLGQTDSVATHYEGQAPYGDESTATPGLSDESDGSAFYRALDRFYTTPSSLGVAFCNEDISAFDHFDGASHIYSFDIAMEKALVNNIVRQFVNTRSAWLFASFNGDLIERFDLTGCFLAARVPCQMYKSGERRCCYIYVKSDWESIKREHDAIIGHLFDITDAEAAFCAGPTLPNPSAGLHSHRLVGPPACRAGCGCTASTLHPFMSAPAFISGWGFRSAKTVLLSQFNEPVSVLELVKLAKMPLEAQMGWYLKRVVHAGVMLTRSKRVTSLTQARQSLCLQRSKLLEMIATSSEPAITQKYVRLLQRHIRQKYMPVHSFTHQ